jgi:hypothetical protein
MDETLLTLSPRAAVRGGAGDNVELDASRSEREYRFCHRHQAEKCRQSAVSARRVLRTSRPFPASQRQTAGSSGYFPRCNTHISMALLR